MNFDKRLYKLTFKIGDITRMKKGYNKKQNNSPTAKHRRGRVKRKRKRSAK